MVASYEYDPYGKILSATGTMASANPLRYRGYYYDSELEMYYLQSRYYDPNTGRFINADGQINPGYLGLNLFSYAESNPVAGFDADGRRTYFINGINNNTCGVPSYATKFCDKLEKLGVRDARPIAVYRGQSGFVGTFRGVSQVVLEMLNVNVYTNAIVNLIYKDLKNDPLARGEQLNLIGYSGGGQIAMNVMEKMKGKITNVVLIGTPILETWTSKTKVSLIYGGWDPLSWNIGWGYKSYFAGWIGHTDYFNNKNISKVAGIVNRIIN